MNYVLIGIAVLIVVGFGLVKLGRWANRKSASPEWGNLYNDRELTEFLRLVRDYFQERNVKIVIQDGVVFLMNEKKRCRLENLAKACRQAEPAKWKGMITEHFNAMKLIQLEINDLEKLYKNYDKVSE